MTPESVADIFRSALYITMLIISMVILPGLLVGILISIFQAATQINESTLSFFPKIMVVLGILFLGGSWIIHQLVDYTKGLILDIPDLIG